MKSYAAMWVVLGFLALIGLATWCTKNPNCLWALLLFPKIEIEDK